MKYGVLIIACVLLASCATMKENNTTAYSTTACQQSRDDAVQGKKEFLAGAILLPTGVGMTLFLAPPLYLLGEWQGGKVGSGSPGAVAGTGIAVFAIGGAAMIAGIVLLIDGGVKKSNRNNYCAGSTAAERYCLFDQLSEPKQ